MVSLSGDFQKKYLPRNALDVPSLDVFKASPDSAMGFRDTKGLELS